MSTSAADVQAAWARHLIDAFVAAGVRDAVISPGSRSTPFVLAAITHPDLRCRDVVDERSAAFWALGHAKITGRPVLLVCTSGTAGAHYLPAVIEARHAHVPMLMLTTDRPQELVGCGANQTIDQAKLFGDHAVAFFDLGAAEASARVLVGLRQLVGRAVAVASGPVPGAVQLNARARKPLEPGTAPEAPPRADGRDASAPPRTRPLGRRFQGVLEPDPEAIVALADALSRARRPLIVCGPAPVGAARFRAAILRVAVLSGAPLLAETASQQRLRPAPAPGDPAPLMVDAFDGVLRGAGFRRRMAPDVVLQIGAAPTSAVWARYLEEHGDTVSHWVLARHGWPDPGATATAVIEADVARALAALAKALVERGAARAEPAWRRAWREAESAAWTAVEEALAAPSARGELTEGLCAQIAADVLPEGALLCLGNSLPIRQVDTWVPGRARDVAVWHQRGVSGIDGLLAGGAGAATASRRPTLAVVGDVSFLHDVGSLAVARAVREPYVILVIDNRGGRIFEQLPVADVVSPSDLAHWTTPHEADLGSAASAWGLPFARCTGPDSLRAAVATGLAHRGCSVVVAVVPVHGAVAENRALWSSIERRVEDLA